MAKQKKVNKMPSQANQIVGGDTVPPLAAADSAETSWLDSLSPAERELEEQRRESRQKKAELAKQQQEIEQTRREKQERERKNASLQENRASKVAEKARQQERARAAEEGMLEAQQFGDEWYVDLDGGIWKSVDQAFWCRYCEAGMNESAITDHLNGDRHRKSKAASGYASPLTLPSPCRAHLACGSNLGCQVVPTQIWQEVDDDGFVRCMPCNKVCDGVHETTADHARRLQAHLMAIDCDYKEPDVPWLAWVPCEEWGEGRFLKCLLCNKWVADLEGTDPRGYDGNHGALSSKNQKDHKRKMDNLEYYKQDRDFWNAMMAERNQWHPPPPAKPQTPTPQATTPQAVAPQELVRAHQNPPLPSLPEGWQAAYSEEHEALYYWSDVDEAQWEVPIAPTAISSA